jgi:hypothetical protein
MCASGRRNSLIITRALKKVTEPCLGDYVLYD